LSSRDAVIRRALFGPPCSTGAALVGSQFGCDQPQSTPSSAGFPHAGRWPLQQGDTLRGSTAEADSLNWWIQPGASEKQSTQALIQKVDREGILNAGALEPSQNVPQPEEKPVPVNSVEPSG
jgi:hypothetical protein